MRIFTYLLMAGTACTISLSSAHAQDHSMHMGNHDAHHSHSVGHYAPIGVMGDHLMNKGEYMVSYRYMHMDMEGNREGTSKIDPVTIATTVANRFSGVAGQPSTLRVVPTEMTMDMHMLGAMYAPRDWLTLSMMVNYLEKEMDHITFQGGAGTNILGRFTTKSEGWSDVKVSGLFRVLDGDIHHVHLNAGLSLPTGSIDEEATVLAPNGATPRLRMPYAMQLGTGTYDLLPGVTYIGQDGLWSWGAQYMAEIRLEAENDEGYAWGDKHTLNAWGGYQWAPWVSSSLRISASTQDSIDGIDSEIVAPVQTADPDNYGGDVVELSLGTSFYGTQGALEGHRLALEATMPIYRDLNGPQLETDWSFTLGWQYAF